MALGVHRDETGKLHQAGIDHPADALVFRADALDCHFLELAHRHPAAKIGHLRRRRIRVDRATDQRERLRLRLGVELGEVGGGRQRERGGLADRDDVDIGPQRAHEIDKIEGVVLDIELALRHRNIAGVVPVGDIDLAIGQQRIDRRAQERGVVARHRRHQQHPARFGLAALCLEMDQVAERALDHLLDADGVIAAIFADQRVDPPVGLGNHSGKAALRHLTPGGQPLKPGVWHRGDGGVIAEGGRGCTKPLVGVAQRLHQVIGRHVAHKSPRCCLHRLQSDSVTSRT